MAKTLRLVGESSNDYADEIRLKEEDLPENEDLTVLIRMEDGHGGVFYITSEVADALLWVGRPHTAEDP